MNQIYYLISSFDTKRELMNLYLVEDRSVKYLVINEKKEKNHIVKDLSIYSKKEFDLDKDEDLLEALFSKDELYSKYSDLKKHYCIEPAYYQPGQYYARVYRPIIGEKKVVTLLSANSKIKNLENEIKQYRDFIPYNNRELISSVNQLSVLSQNLALLFQTIEPDKINYHVFGHNIRNLLILTCTEVEAQLKGVYQSIARKEKDRYYTTDYVKLCEILKLKDYSVNLGYFPLDNDIEPFKNWDASMPTKSISWYDNYNAVKHDRENQFSKATLWSVIEAIAGLAILLIAQYGENLPYWKEQIGGFFTFNTTPNWEFTDKYLPPFSGEDWKKNYKTFE